MSDRLFDRAVRDWLDDGSDRTPPAAIDAVLLAVTTTPQERDLRILRRTTQMPTYVRLAAGIVIVAVVGVSALMYFGKSPGVGGAPIPSPTPTPVASTAPSAPPSLVAPGISGWKPYTSAAYGFTMSYPSDWSVAGQAGHKWQPGEPGTVENASFADSFAGAMDADGILIIAFQVPAPAGADLESWEGLHAVHRELCDEPTIPGCPADYTPVPMCVGGQDCAPAIIALNGDDPFPVALIGDPEKGIITVIWIARVDSFPGAERYGGTVQLLKSVLTQLDVRDPQPGETPH
jgi:hypothetical protein